MYGACFEKNFSSENKLFFWKEFASEDIEFATESLDGICFGNHIITIGLEEACLPISYIKTYS